MPARASGSSGLPDHLITLSLLRYGTRLVRMKRSSAAPQMACKRLKTGAAAATRLFFAEHNITVTGSAAQRKGRNKACVTLPEACVTLEDAPFAPELVAALHAQGFTAPSAVQGATWPLAVRGLDVLAIAGTGQGKTLGYLLPALSRSASSNAGARQGSTGPCSLVVVPTRELALQVQAEARKFGDALGLRAAAWSRCSGPQQLTRPTHRSRGPAASCSLEDRSPDISRHLQGPRGEPSPVVCRKEPAVAPGAD